MTELKEMQRPCEIRQSAAPHLHNASRRIGNFRNNDFTMSGTMKKNLKQSIASLASISGLLLLLVFMTSARKTGIISNGLLDELEQKLQAYQSAMPEDRVYLKTDKPFYRPGEDIWFSAFIRNGSDLKPSEKSEVVYVELINPKGNVEKTLKLIGRKGISQGDFAIEETAAGGLYKIKAYTQWQKNEKTPKFFEKEITVQKVVLPRLKMKLDFQRKAYGPGDEVTAEIDLQTNENQPLSAQTFNYSTSLYGQQFSKGTGTTTESGKAFLDFQLPGKIESSDGVLNVMIEYNGLTESISRSIPIVLNKIDVQVFPEGGDLVAGIRSRIAFSAKNEFGKPADIEGNVIEMSTGIRVAIFNSYHDGMGSFYLTPEAGKKYELHLTKPAGSDIIAEVPDAMEAGYVLNLEESRNDGIIVNVKSTEAEELGIVATVRGKMYYKHAFQASSGDNRLKIPVEQMPMGVVQLTLFDSRGIERAERLTFVNSNRQLKIEIKTDKEKYLPREKVQMTMKVTDDRGIPMPANLSLSVTNDQLLAFADDKQGNIIAQLLLQNDLAGEVEEPNFYFDKKEEKSREALDLLMLTSGWRRFSWKEIAEGKIPAIGFQGELASLAGVVLDAYDYKPVQGVKVTSPDGKSFVLTDENGKFRISDYDIADAAYLGISKDGYSAQSLFVNSYRQDLTAYIYDYKKVNQNQYYRGGDGFGNKKAAMGGNRNEIPMAAPQAGVWGQAEVADMPARDNGEGKEREFAPEVFAAIQDETVVDDDGVLNDRERENQDFRPDQNAGDNIEMDGDALDMEEEIAAFGWDVDQKNLEGNRQAAGPVYYRARVFPKVEYQTSSGGAPDATIERNDFRSTIYWNPNLEVDRSGKAEFSFYNSDEISSFRTVVEGIAQDGMVGVAEFTHFTQLPFTLEARVPVAATTQDQVVIPVTLKNNTAGPITGKLGVMSGEALKPVSSFNPMISLEAGQAKTLYLAFQVQDFPGPQNLKLHFESQGLRDGISTAITVAPMGFPVSLSFAGKQKTQAYQFVVSNLVNGSLKAKVTAYPNLISDLLKGIESILRAPYGCFEQTSTSSYPNLLVMNYLKNQENPDPAIYERAEILLNQGYSRLTTYETSQKGYEWFGSAPGHEALTAYGLLQFNDMKKVSDKVDQAMIDRTAKWLLSRRDGKGGFMRDPKALDSFGSADPKITNAYIVWALAEAGYREIEKELNASFDDAMSSKDPYRLSLVANALYAMKDDARGDKVLAQLLSTQAADGSFNGTMHSITVSGGQSLMVETTALAISSMIAGNGDMGKLTKAVEFLVSQRSGHGGFSTTQGTILSLRAMTKFAEHSKRTDEAGTMEIFVDGKKAGSRQYEKGERGAIEISGLEKFIGTGKHEIEVKFVGVENPLPYSVAVDYSTTLPNSSDHCKVKLDTRLAGKQVKMGETLRLTASLQNTTATGLPMTMAVIGLPAGMSAQPWQLKEMQEQGVFDFYETRDNNLICYYRQMKPSELREIKLDLKADIPGTYDAPASAAYLYYTPEDKFWCALPTLTVSQ